MKILQVGKYFPPEPGGMETSLFQLCDGLTQVEGVNVTCLVANTSPSTVTENVGKIGVIRAARFGSVASTPICPTFRRKDLERNHDLLHFHLPNPLATLAYADCDKPYVVTYHCDIVRYPGLLKAYIPALRSFLKNAKRVIVTSKALEASSPVLREFGIKCDVIPLGLDPTYLEPNSVREKLRSDLREKFGNKIVLFVGRLVPYKGLGDLIRAMEQVDGALLIVGQGPEKERLQMQINENGLENRVRLMGFIPDEEIGAYYHASDVVALTSNNTSEAFGMCLLEAQACKKALLTTRLPTGVATVNLEEQTGLLAEVGDSAGMAEGLSRILGDPKLSKKLGEGGYAHFRKNFDRRVVVESHVSLYRDILGAS
jgi:glycosyltransferase involved in cell wall biosynthesis